MAEPRLVLDNRVNVSDAFDQLINYAGVNVNTFEIQPDGTTFNTQILFNNIVVPNLSSTLVSRNMRLRYNASFTYDATLADGVNNGPKFAGVNVVYNGNNVQSVALQYAQNQVVDSALRAPFPIQSVCNSVSLTINSGTTTINSRQVLDPIARKLSKKYLMNQATECPSMLDNRWILTTDPVATDGNAVNGDPTVLHMNSCQPLSKYENNCGGFSRASFLPVTVSANGNNITVVFNVVEQIAISPLTLHDKETFLANVNTLSLLLSYGSSLSDLYYTANPAGVAPTIAILSPKLLLTYIQVNPEIMTIPRAVNYNYENVVYFAKSSTQALTAGTVATTIQLSSDTVRFQCMPSMIYVFLRNQVSQRTPQQTQTFYQWGFPQSQDQSAGLQINIGNRTGLLASASPQTLWRISKNNGFAGSFNEWQQGCGVFCLNPVSDLGIDPSLDTLPLETGSVNFQVSATWNNANLIYSGDVAGGNAPVELMIVAVYAGVATITTDQCMFSLGSLSANEVSAVLSKSGNMISSEHVQPTIQAEGLFSKGKHILGKMAGKHMRRM